MKAFVLILLIAFPLFNFRCNDDTTPAKQKDCHDRTIADDDIVSGKTDDPKKYRCCYMNKKDDKEADYKIRCMALPIDDIDNNKIKETIEQIQKGTYAQGLKKAEVKSCDCSSSFINIGLLTFILVLFI